MRLKALLPFAFALSAFAQPAPQAPTPTPQFTTIEIAGLSSLLDKKKQAQETLDNINRALAAAEADIAKNHPGFEFSEKTNSLVPVEKPTTPAKK